MKTLNTEPATSSTLRLTHDAKSALAIVANWHDETHDGRFELCMEQTCHAVQRKGNRQPW